LGENASKQLPALRKTGVKILQLNVCESPDWTLKTLPEKSTFWRFFCSLVSIRAGYLAGNSLLAKKHSLTLLEEICVRAFKQASLTFFLTEWVIQS